MRAWMQSIGDGEAERVSHPAASSPHLDGLMGPGAAVELPPPAAVVDDDEDSGARGRKRCRACKVCFCLFFFIDFSEDSCGLADFVGATRGWLG